MIGQGDYFMGEVNYAEGASGYVFTNPTAGYNHYYRNGDTAAFGVLTDAVFGGTITAANNTALNLTTAWNVNAAFEHHWNAQWKTDVYGGYAEVNYNNQANAILCSLEGIGAGVGTAATANAGCNNDWTMWWVGSRTQWNVTKDFYMGVDVMYSSVGSMSAPGNVLPTTVFRGAPTANFLGDQDAVSAEFRVHKDFYP